MVASALFYLPDDPDPYPFRDLLPFKEEKDTEVILPKKCYEEIRKIALSYGMQVLDETDEFELGVIIKSGKIEYNYDFEENMKFMDEEIEKEIDTILFS